MNYHAPSKCPVCGQTMEVTRLHCRHCETELTGNFAPCKFCMIEVFLRCRGSIKEVEKALGVSYPTVRNMMDAALEALGLGNGPTQTEQTKEQKREKILEQLAEGEIDADTAVARLNEIKGEK